MANVSKNTESKYLLDGQPQNAPIEWEDVEITADYVNDSIQPSLTIEDFVFPLEARDLINDWIAKGVNGGVGIFEGMPFQLTLFNNQPVQENFNAFIDFTNNYQDLPDDGTLNVSIMKDRGLDNFFDQIEGLTYGYLESINAITIADYIDIEYVVEKKFNLFDILLTSIVLYLMIKELIENTVRLIEQINKVTSAAPPLPTVPPVPNTNAIIYAAISAIINVIYVTVMLLAVIEIGLTLVNTLVPPKRKHKAISLKTALQKVCQHLGYGFVAPITELDRLVYLPSNQNLDEKTFLGFINQTKGTPSGIPNTLDYGYNCSEMFELAKNLFYAKMAIIGNDVHLRPKNDPFWQQTSVWTPPSILINTLQYNTDDMKATRLLTFKTDLNDEWTIDNYLGTSYEVKTTQVSTIRQRAVLLKGLDEVRFNVALGNRKDELNGIERLLKGVLGFIDNITGLFGGGTNYVASQTSKIGLLKQSTNWHAVPKLLYVSGGKLPTNHRTLFKAKNLYDRYHKEKSFVLDNWRNQKLVYNDIDIPFGFEDYKQLTDNPYFYYKGSLAKITKFVWRVGQDTATISFWIRQPYTYNLREFYIEQP